MPTRPTREELITEAWYPKPENYWVPPDEREADQADAWPHRYGDLFHTPSVDSHGNPLTGPDGNPWDGVMVMSPSCELISKAKRTDTVEVVRVLNLDSQDPNAAQKIITGWQVINSRVVVAYAHTVFLAPVTTSTTHSVPMFAHLKTTTRVKLSDLREAGRIAASTHDTRVCVIRRDMYYRYRWLVPMSEVRESERLRISADADFTPPRPDWAPLTAPA